MKWLQNLRGDSPRETDPDGGPDSSPRADEVDPGAARAGNPASMTTADAAPLDLEEQSVALLSGEPGRSSDDSAPAATSPASAGGPADDLSVIKAAIDRAFQRFERLAAGGDEIKQLLRSHLDRQPVSAAENQSPAGPSAGPSAGIPPEAAQRLDEILLRQQELNRLFESRIRSDEVQAKALERLHDELRQYKANFIRQEMLPLFKDVIFCHDFVTKELERLKTAPPSTTDAPVQATRALEILSQMLLDLLFKYDIEPYRGEGEQFDAKRQQCARTLPTDLADRDKAIAELGLTGFQSPEGIVRREQVTVYKYKPATP